MTDSISQRVSAVFIEEMVKHLKPLGDGAGFAGGPGEAHFQSFLEREYAAAISARVDLKLKTGTAHDG